MNAREKLRSLNVSQGDYLKSSLEMTFNVFERQEENKKQNMSPNNIPLWHKDHF